MINIYNGLPMYVQKKCAFKKNKEKRKSISMLSQDSL